MTFRETLYISTVAALADRPDTEETIVRMAVKLTGEATAGYCAAFGHDLHVRADVLVNSCDRCGVGGLNRPEGSCT